ncbi:hypothetical protein H2200_001251 [Cladophialophora chaetospira]|uniref:Amino acid permease/ SLC12A domain-containing protein n=1 Tax=Cladophialophora chaetospira TaxID=386627 RepID=A0AA38XKI2_9EURO|nr:hypothetical protein H2200_001251 [Cladophialophora chaetospira]
MSRAKPSWRWRRYLKGPQGEATVNVTATDAQTSSQGSQDGQAPFKGLERKLHSPQIFMIALSGILGLTIFATMGQFLRTTGPAGLFVAIGYVALTAFCVMEGLGELVVQWPVANAMIRYVEVFVDEELAIVVGLVYW